MPSEYPTNDIVVAEAPALRRWLNEKLRDAINARATQIVVRVKEGARRHRSNNKKTFTLMSQLRDEFRRLRQLLELVRRREQLKLAERQQMKARRP